MDLIMGRFADAHIAELSERDLDDYERLIQLPDADLYAWIAGHADIPAGEDCELLRRLCAFHSGRRDPT
jgi:antitoxin CptB